MNNISIKDRVGDTRILELPKIAFRFSVVEGFRQVSFSSVTIRRLSNAMPDDAC